MIENDFLPKALAVGVDYQCFWTLNPRKLKPFFTAYQERKKAEIQQIDYQAWLQGGYFMRALGAAFSKKSNSQYPKRPLTIKEENTEVQGNNPAANKFFAWAVGFNKANFGISDVPGKEGSK